MASGFKNFIKGISLVPNTSTLNTTKGDMEYLSSDDKLRVHNGTINEVVVTETSSAILTNKTIAAGSNTITGLTNSNLSGTAAISNANLANSSVTVNGSSVSLGGSITITANTTNALTIGTGLSGTSFNGSAAVTIAIDSTVVTLTGSQALSNKTLTSPIINTATADTITGIAAGPLTLTSPTGQNLILQNATVTTATVTSTGVTLASAKLLTLTNNSQTVSMSASASASASYTITLPAAAPAASTALVYDGSNYVWSSAGGWTMSSSTSLTASGTITISTSLGQQVFRVASSSGAVTLSTTPFGTSAPVDGAAIRLIGTSDTNTVQISFNDAAKGCLVNGTAVLRRGNVIEFQYSSTDDRYYEVARNF